jgi:uridine kinase
MHAFDTARAVVAAAAPPSGTTTTIVAIDGPGGSGKSTLAAQLADELGAQVVHTDDFASWDVPIDWWPRLRDEVLIPLADGRAARFQRYDWERKELGGWQTVEPGGLVLLEGVTASREAFRPYLAASIWVETPRDLRLERGLERDGADAAELWAEWMAGEDQWMAAERPQEHVTAVVPGF